jgi:uncharacterized protein (DUF1501 family)
VPIVFPGFTATAFARNPLLDSLLNAQSESDRILVLINLSGGNDGLNTCIPFGNDIYHQKRPNIGYTTAEQSLLTPNLLRPGMMALNPQLNKLMSLWNTGKLGVVQNVGYPEGSRSHFRSTDIWNTASDSNLIVSTGWVGRYLESLYPEYPLGTIPADPLAMSMDYAPPLTFQGSKSMMGIAVPDPTSYTGAAFYTDDTPPNNNYGDELAYLRNILIQSFNYDKRFAEKFKPGTPPTNNVAYPTGNTLAQQLKKVAWCIAAGMTTKVYFVSQGGYDTHIQQTSKDPLQGQGRLLLQLAEAISLFQADIEAFGAADRVIGMTYSEFGRRVEENSSAGTDHGAAAPQFLFGNAINGELYGEFPDLTPYNAGNPNVGLDVYSDIRAKFDFRQLFAGVLTDWFGEDDAKRKAILNKAEFTSQNDFGFQFPVNGSAKTQSLIKPEFLSVPQTQEVDRIFVLEQNYPNPVRSETTIAFRLSESANVRLEVFDSRGELIATPVQSNLGRGEHPVMFDARRLTNGTYFYRLDVNGMVETKSMTVVR